MTRINLRDSCPVVIDRLSKVVSETVALPGRSSRQTGRFAPPYRKWLLEIALGATLLSGCASAPKVVLDQTVGPAPDRVRDQPRQGHLIVYSARESLLIGGDPDHPQHTDYSIHSSSGQVIQHVRNRRSAFDEEPSVIHLPVGRYRVTAWASAYGLVSVPVIVKAQQTTVLYLDGSTRPEGFRAGESDLVRLPNGEIVGWRAEE